jgi:23S rRNA pseudouridine1911/1915/1917 synthase
MPLKDLSRPTTELHHVVTDAESGERLDHVLSAWITWRSRNDLQDRIRKGTVVVNGRRAKSSARVKTKDRITVHVEAAPGATVDASSIPLRGLYEEDMFVVIDKPAGAVIHPVGKYVLDTLMNVLHARYRPQGVVPMVVHRLDKDTSGVLVVAKDEAARRTLGAAFEGRDVLKEYVAIVHGEVAADRVVNLPIGPDPSGLNKTKMACGPDGRPSRTTVRVEQRLPGATLVRCLPHTGRQHQIRVHLAAIGHPIAGDVLYGGPSDTIPIGRQALHAARLVVPHPVTGVRMAFDAPLPEDLERVLATLRALM